MQIKVTQNEVKINKDILNDGEYNIHKCEFDFDEEYNGLVQKAVFTLNDGTPYLMTIVNNECNIPIEVLEEGVLKIGVYAYETEGDELVLRYSPSPDIIHVFDGSYVKDAQNTEPITPTDKEQIEQAITNLQNDVADLDEEKQDKLISGENIKTINGESVLGEGNIEVVTDLSDYYTKEEVDQSQASQNENIQANAGDISDIKSEQITQNVQIGQNKADIEALASELIKYSLITETGSQIALNVNSSNYQMTAILKDKNGNVIYTSNVIDLPIESMIINVTYDSSTKEIVFTLQNGNVLRVSVADLVSGLVSTNELNIILANYYTKTEIDTLLNGYVDTTAYTQGQSTQDANIEENASNIESIESLINQMPTISGQGTDLSLESVLNYRLMKFLPQGVSSQDGEPTPTTPIPVKSVTGENSVVIGNRNVFINNWETGGISESTGENVILSGRIRTIQYTPIFPNKQYYISRTDATSYASYRFYDKNYKYLGYNATSGMMQGTNMQVNVYNSTFTVLNEDVKYMRIVDKSNNLNTKYLLQFSDVTDTYYVEHEEQNYRLSLGNIELNSSPDGTIRDGIVGKPNEWYKREYIHKFVITGTELWNKYSTDRYFLNASQISVPLKLRGGTYCTHFKWETSQSSAKLNNCIYITSNNGNLEIYPSQEFFNTYNTAAKFKEYLQTEYSNNNPVIAYYQRLKYTDIPITDTTLINQLNDIYNNAHSYNGVTNITTTYASGNEQMYLDIEALKNVWEVTE